MMVNLTVKQDEAMLTTGIESLGLTIDALLDAEVVTRENHPETVLIPNDATITIPSDRGIGPLGPRIFQEWGNYASRLRPYCSLTGAVETDNIFIIPKGTENYLTLAEYEARFQLGSTLGFRLIKLADGSFHAKRNSLYPTDSDPDIVVEDETVALISNLLSESPLVSTTRLMTSEEFSEWDNLWTSLSRIGGGTVKNPIKTDPNRSSDCTPILLEDGTRALFWNNHKNRLEGQPESIEFPIEVKTQNDIIGYTMCKITNYVTPTEDERPIDPLINFGHGLAEIKKVVEVLSQPKEPVSALAAQY